VEELEGRAADDEASELVGIGVAHRFLADEAPVAHHHDPVGDPKDLIEAMRDVDHADAGALKPRTPSNRRSTSSAGRLAVGSSSTRKSQLTTSARAIATSNFSVRLKLRTLRLGSISPINASASSGVSATGSPDRQKEKSRDAAPSGQRRRRPALRAEWIRPDL
jgi:hypothetical protein